MTTPLIQLNKGDAIVIDNVWYHELARTKSELTLTTAGRDSTRVLTADQFLDLYFDPACRIKIVRASAATLDRELVEAASRPYESFTTDQQTAMIVRLDYVKACDRFFARGLYNKRPEDGYHRIAKIVTRYRRLALAKTSSHHAPGSQIDEVSGSTLRDWYGRWRRSGRMFGALAPQHHKKGRRRSQLDSIVTAIIAHYVREKWLTLERPPLTVVHDLICREIQKVNAHSTSGLLDEPSEMAVRRWIASNLDSYEISFYRKGRKEADHETRLAKRAPAATRPLQVVEFDDTPLDVIIVDEHGEQIGRAYLTAGICQATGMIVGWHIGVESPSWSTVMQALRMAVLRKSKRELDACGAQSPYPVYGIPEMIKVDNGAAYRSQSMVAAAAQLQFELRLVPVGKPHLKGKVERFFGEVARDFFSLIPGRTFSSIHERGDYDSERYARFTLGEIRGLFTRWVVDIYHNRPNGRTFGQTPLERWHALSGFGVRLPPEATDLSSLIGLVVNRAITPAGITFMGLTFSSDALADFRKRGLKNQEWMVKIDPMDVSQLLVLDELGHRWVAVPCLQPELVDGLTLQMWMDVVRTARAATRSGQRVSRSRLLTAREYLMREARAAGNKPRGRPTEVQYRWMKERLDDPYFIISIVEEDEDCLSAQVESIKTPKDHAKERRKRLANTNSMSVSVAPSLTAPVSEAKGHPVSEQQLPNAELRARIQSARKEDADFDEAVKLETFSNESAQLSRAALITKDPDRLDPIEPVEFGPSIIPLAPDEIADARPHGEVLLPVAPSERPERQRLVDEDDDDEYGKEPS